MKRACPFDSPHPKRVQTQVYLQRNVQIKRACPFDSPHPKRVHVVEKQGVKRKQSFEDQSCKRRREDELESLQNLITEAYARIHELETEIKRLKMVQHFCNERMNLPYNHNILCY